VQNLRAKELPGARKVPKKPKNRAECQIFVQVAQKTLEKFVKNFLKII
jgi:hypothetical protein